MMKSRPSLRNSVRAVLSLFLLSWLLSGCSSSITATYPKESIDEAIQNICKNEYHIDVKTLLLGDTIWVYLPLEDLFEKSKKPDKVIEKFLIEQNQNELKNEVMRVRYIIRPIPDKAKLQELAYNKKALEKINSVWRVVYRVILSMERSRTITLDFFCLVIADIKNGFEIRETLFIPDLKKFSYGFISMTEYQHRTLQETAIAAAILRDKEGLHVNYQEVAFKDFLTGQIEQRIRMKFQKPEVDRNADIDAEILKIAVETLKIYNFKDFQQLELNNLFTNKQLILTREDVWIKPLK